MTFVKILKTASSLWHRDILDLAVSLRFVLVWQSAYAQNEVFRTKKWLCTRVLVYEISLNIIYQKIEYTS